MAVAAKRTDKDFSDFDPNELLAQHGEHGKNIADLNSRLAKIEGNLATPQNLAAYFQESVKDSRVLEGVFAEMFCRFMKENPEVKEAVGKRVNEVDRSFVVKILKRCWLLLWAALIFVVGSVAKEFLQWVSSFIPHH